MTPRPLWGLVSALVVLSLALAASPAQAQSVKLLGDFRDWSAYSATDGNGQICFAVAKPSEVSPSPDGYTQAYLYLTHRPSDKVDNELNLVAGFTMAADQPASLSIGGQSYPLFVQNDAAWLEDPTQTDNLAGSMRAGTTVVMVVSSDKGIKIRETFSLAGATAASKAIATGC